MNGLNFLELDMKNQLSIIAAISSRAFKKDKNEKNILKHFVVWINSRLQFF